MTIANMARYFFHINNGADFIDDVGTEVASLEGVRPIAMKTAAGIIGEDEKYHTGGSISVQVVAEDGESVLSLVMTAVITDQRNVRNVPN
jgi:hypothetical protein